MYAWYAPHESVIAMAWLLWAMSWIAAAAWTRTTRARAGIAELPSRLVSLIGGLLLFVPATRLAYAPMWNVSVQLGWAMFAIVVAGIAFAWWARIHLGALWSGTVTRKFNHRIVDTGPYALVRHPIYTGLLSAAVATGVARGAWAALAGALILCLGIWMKARLEERFLSEQLGPEYAAYRARVPMLVPFLRF